MSQEEANSVVDFWRQAGADAWFAKDDAFDARFRNSFIDLHFAAARRQRDAWLEWPEGSLALMVLLDQFPRNCFRGTAHMFATDPLARHFADKALAAGHNRKIEPELRTFFYLPFMHSEILADQERCAALYRADGSDNLKYALQHGDIIRRFGRFPHRNPALGRDTSAAEAQFLADGGFSG